MVLEIQEQVCSLLLIWLRLSSGAASHPSLTRLEVKESQNSIKDQLLNCFMVLSSEAIDLELFKMHSSEANFII